jgi:DNA-binding MarR family transcriptional regulator
MKSSPDDSSALHELALELNELAMLANVSHRKKRGGLTEPELLTLQLLTNGTLIVGDIERALGVQPAQMSRIIRALEGKDKPMIVCSINPRDKRKIDVELTTHGEKAMLDALSERTDTTIGFLRKDAHARLERIRVLSSEAARELEEEANREESSPSTEREPQPQNELRKAAATK